LTPQSGLARRCDRAIDLFYDVGNRAKGPTRTLKV